MKPEFCSVFNLSKYQKDDWLFPKLRRKKEEVEKNPSFFPLVKLTRCQIRSHSQIIINGGDCTIEFMHLNLRCMFKIPYRSKTFVRIHFTNFL